MYILLAVPMEKLRPVIVVVVGVVDLSFSRPSSKVREEVKVQLRF